MMRDLPFHLVELVACPAPISTPVAPLREVAFRADAWLPAEIDRLRASFSGDDDLASMAQAVHRSIGAIQSKLSELGLRRNSSRSWTELDRAYLAQHYGTDPASMIAAALGRSPGAVYAQAGADGLTEPAAPPYTDWEIAQIRVGYAEGIPVSQLAVLIGRTVSGVASLASDLRIAHAHAAPGWSSDEQQRALALAENGMVYRTIAKRLNDEGFPRREPRTVGQTLRRVGYGRGWGRPWLEEEKALLRQAYATGSSLAPLRTRLGRSRTSISFQAKTMGLHGTHIRHNGWCIEPPWTEAELEMLRRDYGRVRTVDLAAALHRSKGGVFNKAFSLGLKHGFMRAFTEDEDRAIAIAHEHVLSITDLAAALGRDVAVVSKHAIRMGLPFSGRTLLAPRGRLIDRQRWTLRSILALGAGQARVLTMLTQAEDQDEARVDNPGA